MDSNVKLTPATLDDYPTIQNMAQYYVYESSRECGFYISGNGQYELSDYKVYFEAPDRRAYFIRVEKEIAGFVLLNKVGTSPDLDWNMGEFFVLAKFQKNGVGRQSVKQIWQSHLGKWEVPVLLENNRALSFWRSVIGDHTKGQFSENIRNVGFDKENSRRVIFNFEVG